MSNITNVTIMPTHIGPSGRVSFDCADLSIKQTVAPQWAEEAAYGKMDPIATYGRTARTATINMIVIAQTAEEAKTLQHNVDRLYKINYPAFTGAGMSLSAPPFFIINALHNRMFRELKGFFTEVTITPGSDTEIVPLMSGGKFFERRYDIALGMTVMHDAVPGWGAGGFGQHGGFVYGSNSADWQAPGGIIDTMGSMASDIQDSINETVTSVNDAASTFGASLGNYAESLKDRVANFRDEAIAAQQAKEDAIKDDSD